MKFDSFGDFLAMGHHGLFVWSAYGICFAVLAINVALPLMAREAVAIETPAACATSPSVTWFPCRLTSLLPGARRCAPP